MSKLRLAVGIVLGTLALHAGAAESDDMAPVRNVQVPAVADFNTCAKPVWPRASLRNEESGAVILSFLIGVEGTVREAKVHKTSGFRDLDRAALDGISKCRFRPATMNTVPVERWMQMQYVWVIEKKIVAPAPAPAPAAERLY